MNFQISPGLASTLNVVLLCTQLLQASKAAKEVVAHAQSKKGLRGVVTPQNSHLNKHKIVDTNLLRITQVRCHIGVADIFPVEEKLWQLSIL